MTTDVNPRKKLYSTLVSSSDPDVKQHFSQWTEDEFDQKLANDKTFQQDLFLDLKDIGIAKDQAAFNKEYISATAPVKQPAAEAKPAAMATEPVKIEQPKSGRVAYEKLDGGKQTTSGKILSGISKGIEMVTAPISAAINFGTGLIKAGKGTDIATGYKETKTKPQTEFTTQSESAAINFDKEYDPVASKMIKAEEDLNNATNARKDYLKTAKNVGIDPRIQAVKLKEFDDVIGKNQVIIGAIKQDYDQKKLQFNDRLSEWAKDEAGKAPKEAYTKDGSGFEVPKEEYVVAKANKLAEKMGVPVGQWTYRAIKDQLNQQMRWAKMEPAYIEERDKEFKKLSGGLTLTQTMQKELEEGAAPNVLQNKAQIEYNVKEAQILKDRNLELNIESDAYKTTIGGIQETIKNDSEIKSAIEQFDKKLFDPLQTSVNEGKISADEANKMLGSPQTQKMREDFLNDQVAKKYGPKITEAFDQYLSKVSQINGSAKRKADSELASIRKTYKTRAEQSARQVQTKYKPSARIIEMYKKASDLALKNVEGRSKMALRKQDIEKNFWNQQIASILNGLGKGISSTASLFNLRNIGNFGDVLAAQNTTSDLMIEGWDDYSFDKEGLTKLINTVGVQGGQMLPALAATAAVAAATRGMGTTSLLSRLLVTSVPQWAGATMQIAGQAQEDVFKQTGDAVKASKAAKDAAIGQMYAYPAYLLTGLKFFSDAGKTLLPIGTLGRYATAPTRVMLQGGAEVLGETIEELTENANAEAILNGKDPSFANVMKAFTTENFSKTLAQVAPLSLAMGGAPALYKEGKASVNEKIAGGFYAKNILGKISHPALLKENQAQWLMKLYEDKGEAFTGGMISTMLHRGDIDKKRAQVLAQKLENYKNFGTIKAIQGIENPIVKQTAFVLYDKYQEAKNSGSKEAEAAALEGYQRYMSGKGAELVMVRMPDGDYQIYTYEDFNGLMDNPDFQKAASKNESAHGGVFEITPLIQTNEELQNPKLQQILGRFEAIQNSEETTTKKEEASEVSDDEILAAQKRTGFQVPTITSILPNEYAAVLGAVVNNERGVTPNEISEATRYLYDLRKIYLNMANSSSRNLTMDQIEDITNGLTSALNELSDYKDDLSFGENEVPAPESTEPTAPGPSAQEVAAQSLEDRVAADIKAGRYANATFNSEDEVPEALQPYLARAVRFKQDGVTKIQITAPTALVEQPSSTVQEEAVAEETPVTETTEEAPVVEETPPVEQAPVEEEPVKPAEEEKTEPAKPKAKINLFTDEDAVASFSQKQMELYERMLFNGEEDAAKQMVNAQKQRLVNREIEQVERGEVSEKVKAFYKKFGVDIESVSADDFVRILEENGAAAERTQEGVFDDKNGKIYINKDVFDEGFGTTVIWHEAVHPIMNIIHNSNKPLYDKIHRGIEAAIKANPKGGLAIIKAWVDNTYTDERKYNAASRKDELIVEVIGRLAAGTLSFNEMQPTLRQQFKDLINRIAKIMGLSTADTSDIKALKDLAKKITAEIKKGGEGDLSKIVGLENVGKFQRPGALSASLGGREEMSLQKNGTGIALEGNEKILKGKNAPTVTTAQGYQEDYSLDDIMNTDLAPGSRAVTLALNIAKGDVSYKDKKSDDRITVILPYKNDAVRKKIEKLRNKFSSIKGSSKQATEEKAKIKSQINVEAKKILQEFTELMAQNILALYDTLSPKFMEISKQWYVGANRMANALASKYGKSIEQVSGIIAALSPQKDWFNNVSAAERVIDIMANHADTKLTQEIVDKAVDYNTDRSTKKPKLNDFANDLIDFFKEYGEVSINDLNNSGISSQNQAVILRAIDHAINSPKVAMTDPNGKFIGYDSTPIRWNGFGEIGKAMFMYRSSSIEDINSQLGNGNKVRNFYNNIVDPNSATPYVTADTHAISAALAAPMSAEDASGVGLFLGSKEPLYAIVKDAYIKAADIVGILPREMQSITWEAQRVGINNKNRTEDQKENNFAYIADTRENSQTPYERATELIARNISTNPEWGKDRGIVTQRSVDEIREGAELRAQQRIGEISDLRGRARTELGGAASELGERPSGRAGAEKGTITQKSLGGREKQGTFEPEKKDEESKLRSERAGDRGGRTESRETAPLEGAPSVPGVNGPDPQLVAVADRYAKANGIPLKRQSEYVKVDVNRAKRIAEAYAEMKHDPQNPKVKEAYKDLIKQTVAQYEALAEDGYKFWFIDTNIPSNKEYAETPFNALRDIRKNKEMGVFPTTDGFGSSDLDVSDNPLMEETKYKWPVGGMDGELKPVLANDLFRAVHDAFGHGLEGAAFRARGEENAWQAHIRLFTGPAQGAITSETRGQNSWLNFNSNILKDVVGAEKAKELHPDNWETITVGEHNRNAKTDDTIFADQKTGLMPEWTWTEGRAGDMEEGGTQASLGGRQAAPSFSEMDEVLDMSPVKSRAAREKLIEKYGKETVDRMIEISRNFTKIINGLEEQGVVEKDCP